MVLSEAIRDFAAYSRHELGHTRKTNLCYLSRQRNFARWLEEQGHPDPPVHEISPELIRRYSYSLSAGRLRPRTVHSALNGIREATGLPTLIGRAGEVLSNPKDAGSFRPCRPTPSKRASALACQSQSAPVRLRHVPRIEQSAISQALVLSNTTVKSHLNSLLIKPASSIGEDLGDYFEEALSPLSPPKRWNKIQPKRWK